MADEREQFDKAFNDLHRDACSSVGEVFHDLVRRHGFDDDVVFRLMKAAIEELQAYTSAEDGVFCSGCGCPVDEHKDESDDLDVELN